MPNGGYLALLDLSNPGWPQIWSMVDVGYAGSDVAVAGDYAYVANEDLGFRVVDVSDPWWPHSVATLSLPEHGRGVAVQGDYAYVATVVAGLQVIDISTPAFPRIVGSARTPFAWGVAVRGTTAYVADHSAGLQVVDVTEPESPRVVGGYAISLGRGPALCKDVVCVIGAGLYVLPTQCAVPLDAPQTTVARPDPRLIVFPNPAPGCVNIRLALPTAGRVSASVYDIMGRQVRCLAEGPLTEGVHDFPWDERDGAGRAVASGIYLARVCTPGGASSARIVVVK
jgi:hypothetical protein